MSGPRPVGSILEDILRELRRANDIAEAAAGEASRDALYSPSEAAAYMGRTVATLRNYALRGYLHKVVRGGRTGYLKSEMDRVAGK